VGDDDPPVAFTVKEIAQTETLRNVVENQRSENPSVSRIEIVAAWLSRNRDAVSGPLLPFLRRRFDLTSLQAIDAAKRAHQLEYGG